MNKIILKEYFLEKVFKLVIEVFLIVKLCKVGYFVIVCVGEKGECMLFIIVGVDFVKGIIILVV